MRGVEDGFPGGSKPMVGVPGGRANICAPSGDDVIDGAVEGGLNAFPLGDCKGFPYEAARAMRPCPW